MTPVLRFNQAQETAVLAARRGFNRSQTAMAAALGLQANADSLVGNAMPIPIDAWRRIDDEAATVARDVLVVYSTLAAANRKTVGIGDLVNYFPKISDSGSVHVSMDGRSQGSADQAVVAYEGTPIPIIDSFASFGWRQMEVIRKGGAALDTESIANHQRQVAEKQEDIVLNGLSSIVVGGSTIYGLRNHPQRNTDTHGFDLNSTATGANWLTAFKKVIDACIGDNAFGKVTVFVNYSDWVYASINEFVAGYPKTILQRLREIEQIEDIIPASKVPADNLIGIAGLANRKWGAVIEAMPMVTRPKVRHNPEDDYVFGVMAAGALQLRQDFAGRMPVAHVTAS